jgi:hypothetical protein
MINDDNTNSNSNSNSTTTSAEFPTYKGPVKLVWEAVAQGTPGALQSYYVPKTIDTYDVISETDEIQFSKLKADDQKYDMVKGMITGAETKTENPPFKVSDPYVSCY